MRTILFFILLLNVFLFPEQKILPSDGNEEDSFGQSISVNDNWIAISANKSEYNGINSGSVYLYQHLNETFINEQRVFPSDGEYNDYFGKSISIYDNWLAVSSIYDNENGYKSGSVYLYFYNGLNWVEHTKIIPVDGEPSERFGYSIDIYGNYLAVGAIYDDDLAQSGGSVYLYRLNENNEWIFNNKLLSVTTVSENNNFGKKVSINNDWLAVSSNTYESENLYKGNIELFYLNGDDWIFQQSLQAPDANSFDYFGIDLDIDGNILAAGAHYDDEQGTNSGSVYIYMLNDGIWEYVQKIYAGDGNVNDNFGLSVSLHDKWLGIGSIDDVNGINSGSVYIFNYENELFLEKNKITPNDGDDFDEYSNSLSIFANSLVVGSKYDDDNGLDSGSAYYYVFKGCEDVQACNYGDFLISDQNQCSFPINGFDCDNNCYSEIDYCGICGGSGSSGDVNLDETLNILDIVLIIDHILYDFEINICIADLNANNFVNITDVIIILENILND